VSLTTGLREAIEALHDKALEPKPQPPPPLEKPDDEEMEKMQGTINALKDELRMIFSFPFELPL